MTAVPRPLVTCIGDSITRADVSVDYVDMLRDRLPGAQIRNAGVNYDLAYSVLRRIDTEIDRRPRAVTLLIGTNDANATLSARNRRMMTAIKRLPVRPTAARYREDLQAVVDRLRTGTDAAIGLASPPVIGEDLDSEPLLRSVEFARITREVAAANDCAYLPVNENQVRYLRSRSAAPGTAYRDGMGLAFRASLQHYALRRSFDDIARRRGLALTTDTVHQNSVGAGIIADAMAEFLAPLLAG